MEAFGEAIKVFAEKHLIPTIFSLVIGATIFALTPVDFCLIVKFSKLGYWLFLSGIIFILIQGLIWFKKVISEVKYNLYVRKRNQEYRCKQNDENLEVLWDIIDSFGSNDIKYIKQFLKNNNEPIIIRGYVHYSYGSLFNSPYVKKQEGVDDKGCYTKYILEKSFYHDLKISSKYYGKIGHFEEV